MVVEKGHKIFIPADQLTATEVKVEWQQSLRAQSAQYYAVPFFNRDQDNEESVIFIQTSYLDSLKSKSAFEDKITVIWRFMFGLISKLGNDALKFGGGFIPSIDMERLRLIFGDYLRNF
ncbi:hypothetical protein H9Q72_012395 [Fusarium xylarioides]|uniref:Uncharacterized protein n=1 Tax=Fusarium xylarioides TaxID=221167 RepID=A0A9P7IAE0_9HYPO|nr:hypothetical protein H9Q70_012607 [Fusarium xylarioides]KAG5759475.1 hypothetical protein H9Q72_012395 [Fusarium xylarioides]KAG5773274.1 hypothetical protein H9Q73_012173 [Fusarium xylarioides]KAG5804408.1 hypothetical protein H9Q71_011018 [Fusarium xylarioides]KAG5815308.1 hypothetical protein H9Q74_011754 [Fusarium xylarioides]